MNIIILAAGQGTRLRPHTDDRPKCLVPFLGRTLLDWQLAAWRSTGRHDVHVVTGYRADQVHGDFTLHHNPDYATTNMVESLMAAREVLLEGRDTIVAYGDLVIHPDVAQKAVRATAPVGIVADRQWRRYWEARMEDPLRDAETFRVGADGSIVELGRKPRTFADIQGQYTGILRFDARHARRLVEHYDALPRGATYEGRDFRNMYMTSFVTTLIEAGWPVAPIWTDNGWLEVDTTEELRRYEAWAREGTLARFFDPTWRTEARA